VVLLRKSIPQNHNLKTAAELGVRVKENMSEDKVLLYGDFESDGEDRVRENLALKRYNPQKANLAQLWLKEKEAEIKSIENEIKNEREERTLAIASEALNIAKVANKIATEDLAIARSSAASAKAQARWAMWAAVIASVAAIFSAKEEIFSIIFGTK
jgi:hypothetical protein